MTSLTTVVATPSEFRSAPQAPLKEAVSVFVLQGRDQSGVVQGVFDTEASSRGVRAVSCVAGNDTVTHSNPSVKQFVDLIWNSPDRCSSNDIYFRGAVVRQMSIFWTDWNVKLPFRVTTSTVVSEL